MTTDDRLKRLEERLEELKEIAHGKQDHVGKWLLVETLEYIHELQTQLRTSLAIEAVALEGLKLLMNNGVWHRTTMQNHVSSLLSSIERLKARQG